MDWSDDGGGHVLLAERGAAGWLGVMRPAAPDEEEWAEERAGRLLVPDDAVDLDAPASDYARACAALGEPPVPAALVPFDGGVALALDTIGDQATLLPRPDGLLVVRWGTAPDPEAAAAALAALPPLPWEDTGVRWSPPPGPVVLQAAAEPGASDGLTATPPPGPLAVEVCSWSDGVETSFTLWRLRSA